jgi:hypothetical protein
MKMNTKITLTEGTAEYYYSTDLSEEINEKSLEVFEKGGVILDIKYQMSGAGTTGAIKHSALIIYEIEKVKAYEREAKIKKNENPAYL